MRGNSLEVNNLQIQRIKVDSSPTDDGFYLSTMYNCRLHLVHDNKFSASMETLSKFGKQIKFSWGHCLLTPFSTRAVTTRNIKLVFSKAGGSKGLSKWNDLVTKVGEIVVFCLSALAKASFFRSVWNMSK